MGRFGMPRGRAGMGRFAIQNAAWAGRGGGEGVSIAEALAGTATNVMAISFVDGSMVIRDTTTPANDYNGPYSSKLTINGSLPINPAGALFSDTNNATIATSAFCFSATEGSLAIELEPTTDILGDLGFFLDVWREIRRRSEAHRAPAVLYREQSLVSKLLRDLLNEDYQAIRIDQLAEYRRALDLVQRIMPSMAPRVKHYAKDFPIFDEYGVQPELDRALRSKVWLKFGGYIVINQTEALVAVDVNTGRYVGKKSAGRLEDTILKTNLEAAKEIVRQIRLRDLGGIIVLDFIDMEEKKNRQRVLQVVEQELRRDRAPSKAVAVSEFGLIIVTRKRVKQSLERLLTDQCPYCSGTGTVKSSATICHEILTELKKVAREVSGPGVLLRVHPDIAAALQNEERDALRAMERVVGRKLSVRPDVLLHHEQFDVMVM